MDRCRNGFESLLHRHIDSVKALITNKLSGLFAFWRLLVSMACRKFPGAAIAARNWPAATLRLLLDCAPV